MLTRVALVLLLCAFSLFAGDKKRQKDKDKDKDERHTHIVEVLFENEIDLKLTAEQKAHCERIETQYRNILFSPKVAELRAKLKAANKAGAKKTVATLRKEMVDMIAAKSNGTFSTLEQEIAKVLTREQIEKVPKLNSKSKRDPDEPLLGPNPFEGK